MNSLKKLEFTLFNNVGAKIKKWAMIACVLGTALCLLLGLILICLDAGSAGVLLIFIYPIIIWLSSLFTYGFGQLVENSDKMRKALPVNQPLPCKKCGKVNNTDSKFCIACGEQL